MAVVTIARQLESGGDEIAQAVARELGAPYLDKEFARLAAQRVGLPDDLTFDGEMEADVLASRLLGALTLYDPEVAGSDEPARPLSPLPHRSLALFQQVIEEITREIASRGQGVIVGRGSQRILRSLPHVLHVFIYAPVAVRVERLVAQSGLSPAEAERLLTEHDRERGDFVRTGYGVDWQSPDLYDLIINTGRVSTDLATRLIVTAARAREPLAPARADTPYQWLRQPVYSPREAATLLMIEPEVIRHAVYNGELPAARAGSDILSISRHDLLAWLERRRALTDQPSRARSSPARR
jgi:excisionase family DNA binding protein